MKSPFTGKEMNLVKEKRRMKFRKEEFEYVHHAYQCIDTEEQFTSTELDNLNVFQVYNQYRQKHNIPFPEEIKSIREKYGISAAKMSQILGFGTNTYRLYEDGEVPQTANARSIQIAKSTASFKELVQLCDRIDGNNKQKFLEKIERIRLDEKKTFSQKSIENYLVGESLASEYTGFKTPRIEKLGAMVYWFAKELKPFKTKLNKLLFYADFGMFKRTGQSISGVRYRAIPMGPVPNNFQSIFEYLQTQGIVNIDYTEFADGNIGEQYLINQNFQFDEDILSIQEKAIVLEVIEKFKNDKTGHIIEKSHEELPWLKNKETKNLISYIDGFDLIHI